MSREEYGYLGWILLFLGAMLAITASGQVTQGNIPDEVLWTVGYTTLIGSVFAAIGGYMIIRSR